MSEIDVNKFNGLRPSRRMEFHNWFGASLRGKVDFFEGALKSEFTDYYQVYTDKTVSLMAALVKMGRGWGVVIVTVWGVVRELRNGGDRVTKHRETMGTNKERKAAVKIREELEKFECLGIGNGVFSPRTIKRIVSRLKEKRFENYVALLGLENAVDALNGIASVLGSKMPEIEEDAENKKEGSYIAEFASLDKKFTEGANTINNVWNTGKRDKYETAVGVINDRIKRL
jgi:hypothetical protein